MEERRNEIDIIGFFKVDELNKEYVMYSLMDNNPNNNKANVILGEVKRDGDNFTISNIPDDEVDTVVAFYSEISNQLGGDNN